jgi:hypothetical protein
MRVAKPEGLLGKEEVRRFHEEGFLLTANLLSQEEKKNLLKWVQDIQNLKGNDSASS